MKNEMKNAIMNKNIQSKTKHKTTNLIKLVFNLIILLLVLTQPVYANSDYFTVEVPEGYYVQQPDEGNIKLIAIREADGFSISIQMLETDKYYNYDEINLKETIEQAKKDAKMYKVGTILGEHKRIGKYLAHDVNYDITSTETEESMYIRQIYIYEDEYTYAITIGGGNKKEVFETEIEEFLNSLKIMKYKLKKLSNFKEEFNDLEEPAKGHGSGNFFYTGLNYLIELELIYQILLSLSLIILILVILLVIKRKRKKNKNNTDEKNLIDKRNKKEKKRKIKKDKKKSKEIEEYGEE